LELDEETMGIESIGIKSALSDPSTLIVQGAGLMAANALISAGQPDTSMVVVAPENGQVQPEQTAQQIMTPPDPSAELKIANPQMAMNGQGISTPQMTMGR